MSSKATEEFLSMPIGLAAAVRGHLRFRNAQSQTGPTGMPEESQFGYATCFSIDALQEILLQANNHLRKEGVPEEFRAIAFYNIINDGAPPEGEDSRIPPYLRNKPSIMLVGSKVVPIGKTGQVKVIENELTRAICGLSEALRNSPEQITTTDIPNNVDTEYTFNFFDVGNKHP